MISRIERYVVVGIAILAVPTFAVTETMQPLELPFGLRLDGTVTLGNLASLLVILWQIWRMAAQQIERLKGIERKADNAALLAKEAADKAALTMSMNEKLMRHLDDDARRFEEMDRHNTEMWSVINKLRQ